MTCDDVFDRLTRGPFPSNSAGDELVERHLAGCAECRRLAAALAPALDLLRETMTPEETVGLPGYHGQAPWQRTAHDQRRMEIESADQSDAYPWRVIRSEHSASTPAPVARRLGQRRLAAKRAISPSAPVAGTTKTWPNLFRFAAAVLLGVAAVAGTRGWVAWQAVPEKFSDEASLPIVAAASAGSDWDQTVDNDRSSRPDTSILARLTLPTACRRGNDEASETEMTATLPAGIQLASAALVGRQECCSECHNGGNPGLLPVARQAIVMGACRACH